MALEVAGRRRGGGSARSGFDLALLGREELVTLQHALEIVRADLVVWQRVVLEGMAPLFLGEVGP